MKSIEERIVGLEFQNAQFEKGIQTSLKSLESLNKSLDESDKGKAFEGLTASVQGLSDKFNAMSIVGITALQNITNAAMRTGANVLRSLTIAPVSDGFQEYELKINTLQAVMNATKLSAEDATAQLDRLDEYADKTVYSTRDMFANISRFTNAGVPLDEAATAMIGIANATALAGGGAQEAQRAFFNLGQSMSNGFLLRADFNSLQLANIATVEFNQNLIDSAVRLGTLTDAGNGYYKTLAGSMITATKGFEQSLKDEWATTEVLTDALYRFGDATTDLGRRGWAAAQDIKTFSQLVETIMAGIGTSWSRTFDLLIGDFETAKRFWTDVNAVISVFIDQIGRARNDLLSSWADLGGRTEFLDAMTNAFVGLLDIIVPIERAFNNIFPATTGEQLFAFTEGINNAAKSFRAFVESLDADALQSTFQGIFSIVDLLRRTVGVVFDVVGQVVEALSPGTGGLINALLKVTGSIGNFITSIRNAAVTGGIFESTAKTISNAILTVVGGLNELVARVTDSKPFQAIVQFFTDIVGQIERVFTFDNTQLDLSFIDFFRDKLDELSIDISPISDRIKMVVESIANAAQWVKDRLNQISLPDILNGTFVKLAEIFDIVANGFSEAVDSIRRSISNFDGINVSPIETFGQVVEIAFAPFVLIADGVVWAWNKIVAAFEWARPIVADAIRVISPLLKEFSDNVRDFFADLTTDDLRSMLETGGIIGVIIYAIKELRDIFAPATSLLDKVGDILDSVRGSLEAYQNNLKADVLIKIASAVGILVASLTVLSMLKAGDLVGGLAVITTLLGELTFMMTTLSKSFGTFKPDQIGKALIGVASGLLIFAFAAKVFGGTDVDVLTVGMVAIGAALLELSLFIKAVGGNTHMKEISNSLVKIGTSLLLMAAVVKKFAAMDFMTLASGFTAIGVALLELGVFVKLVGGSTELNKIGLGLLEVSLAMMLIMGPMKEMATMNTETLIQGLGGLGGMLLELAAFVKLTGGAEKVVAVGGAMIIFGGAMLLMVQALKQIANISDEKFGQAMTGFGVLVASAIGTITLLKGVDMAAAAKAMLNFAIFLGAVAVVIAALGLVYKIPYADQIMESGGAMLQAMGEAIGKAIGGIAGGISSAVSDSLPTIASNLAAFMENLQPFITGLTAFDGSQTEGIRNLAQTMLILSDIKVSSEEQIAKISAFGASLEELGPHISSYAKSVEGISGADVEASAAAADILVSLSKTLRGEDGWIQDIFGQADLGMFGTQLTDFGLGLRNYAFSVSGIDVGAITDSAKAAKALVELNNILAPQGGVIDFAFGNNNLGQFAESLPKFALAMRSYALYLGDKYPSGIVWASANAAKSLVEVAKGLSEIGGTIPSSVLIESFTKSLPTFGLNMRTYALKLGENYPSAMVGASANAAKALAEVVMALSPTGGMLQELLGEKNLSSFVSVLPAFGQGMRDYADALGDNFPLDLVGDSTAAAEAMVVVANTLKNQGGALAALVGDNTLGLFAAELKPFGEGMRAYADALMGASGGYPAGTVSSSIYAAQSIAELIAILPQTPAAYGVVSSKLLDFAGDLEPLAQGMVAFSNTIKQGEFSAAAVTNAANAGKMLADMTVMLDGVGLYNFSLTEFGNELTAFGQSFATYAGHVINIDTGKLGTVLYSIQKVLDLIQVMDDADLDALRDFGTVLGEQADMGINRFIDAFDNAHARVKIAMDQFVTAAVNEITNQSGEITTAANKLANQVGDAISKAFVDLNTQMRSVGTYVRSSIETGMTENTGSLITAAQKMAKSIETTVRDTTGVHSESDLYASIGAWIPDSIGSGAEKAAPGAIESVRDMLIGMQESVQKEMNNIVGGVQGEMAEVSNIVADEANAAAPSLKAAGATVSKNIGTGITENIPQDVADPIREVLSRSFKDAKLFIQGYQNEIDYSTSMELDMWRALATQHEKYSKERIEIDNNIAKVEKKHFDQVAKDIENRRKLNQITTEEELQQWQAIQASYTENSELRMQADIKVAELKQRLDKETYENSERWIKERKDFDELSLVEELAAWERVQARYAEGSELRKKAELEIHNVKKSIMEEEQRLQDELLAREQEYLDAVQSRTEAIANAYGLFDAVEEKEEVAGSTLIDNLKAQIAAMTDWADNMDDLATRGIEEGLLAELQAMGPGAAAEIAALSDLSDRELNDYNTLWQEKMALAGSIAVKELENARVQMEAELALIQADLEKLRIPGSFQMTEEEAATTPLNADLKSTEKQGLLQGEAYSQGVSEAEPIVAQEAQNLASQTLLGIEQYYEPVYEAGRITDEQLANGLANNFIVVNRMAQTIANSLYNALDSRTHEYWNMGKAIVQGLADGIRQNQTLASEAAAEVAAEIMSIIKARLGIYSPSQVMYEYGVWIDKGLVGGMRSEIDTIRSTSEEIAEAMIGPIQEAVNNSGNMVGALGLVQDYQKMKHDFISKHGKPGIWYENVYLPWNQFPAGSSIEETQALAAKMYENRQRQLEQIEQQRRADLARTPQNPITFTQINNSPKALDQTTIYRQTKSQLAWAREVVGIPQ